MTVWCHTNAISYVSSLPILVTGHPFVPVIDDDYLDCVHDLELAIVCDRQSVIDDVVHSIGIVVGSEAMLSVPPCDVLFHALCD